MQCPRCGAQNLEGMVRCIQCGTDLPIVTAEVLPEGDSTGGVIPYKNPKALLAYYLGILSGLPLIGLPLGLAAFVLGIQGLRDRQKNPVIKGSIHAGIGIGCGCFFALLWALVIVLVAVGIASDR